jgi:hypothetical protein
MIQDGGFKVCKKCNNLKSVEFFYRSKPLRKNDDGYDYYCKACRNLNSKNSMLNNKRKCSEPGCANGHYALSLCRSHYLKKRNKENKNG